MLPRDIVWPRSYGHKQSADIKCPTRKLFPRADSRKLAISTCLLCAATGCSPGDVHQSRNLRGCLQIAWRPTSCCQHPAGMQLWPQPAAQLLTVPTACFVCPAGGDCNPSRHMVGLKQSVQVLMVPAASCMVPMSVILTSRHTEWQPQHI